MRRRYGPDKPECKCGLRVTVCPRYRHTIDEVVCTFDGRGCGHLAKCHAEDLPILPAFEDDDLGDGLLGG